jgi:hypothetical protein
VFFVLRLLSLQTVVDGSVYDTEREASQVYIQQYVVDCQREERRGEVCVVYSTTEVKRRKRSGRGRLLVANV